MNFQQKHEMKRKAKAAMLWGAVGAAWVALCVWALCTI